MMWTLKHACPCGNAWWLVRGGEHYHLLGDQKRAEAVVAVWNAEVSHG